MIRKMITALMIGGAIATPTIAANATMPARHYMPRYIDRPCAEEDSRMNCYWDAGTMGNHRGHSFFAVRIHDGMGTTCVIYVRRDDAHWNDCS